jgi:hypothetical protein
MELRGSGRSKEERGRVDVEEEKEEVDKLEKLRERSEDGLQRREVWTSFDSIMIALVGDGIVSNDDEIG